MAYVGASVIPVDFGNVVSQAMVKGAASPFSSNRINPGRGREMEKLVVRNFPHRIIN